MNNMPEPSYSAHRPTPAAGDIWHSSRPVPAVPVSYTKEWMYFLMVVCLVVAWWFPAKLFFSHILWPMINPPGQRDSYTFAALAYEGVSLKTNEVSPALFKDHIRLLRKNGFNPITLDDVRDLVLEGKPVPRKAVLVTFDHARKTSYFAAHSVLRRNGWPAVMFLWTKPIIERDPATLLWPYVRNMVRSGIWEIGGQSYDGFQKVPANDQGGKGNFYTTPEWLADENRFESLAEFRERLSNDHEMSRGLVRNKLNRALKAFAYPYGDFGQYKRRAFSTRRINMSLVEKFYGLGFLSGNLAINTRYNDPRRLNRLRVRPEWSGEDLVAFLEKSWPAKDAFSGNELTSATSSWIVDWGNMDMENGVIRLYAPTNTTGSKMWLAGSDYYQDCYLQMNLTLKSGQVGVYLRATHDEESYVYMGIDSQGGVWLRQKFVGRGPFTLAAARVPFSATTVHALEVFIRGNLIFALLDGHPIFEEPKMLRGDPYPGLFGVSIWDPATGRAAVDIQSMTLARQMPVGVVWDFGDKYSSYVVNWLHKNAFRMTDISPLWVSFSPDGTQPIYSDLRIFKLLASMYRLDFMPRVRLDHQDMLMHLSPDTLARRAAQGGLEGVMVDMSQMTDVSVSRVGSWLGKAGAALRQRGIRLLVQFPAIMEKPLAVNSLLAVLPNLQVATTNAARFAAAGITNVIPPLQLKSVPKPGVEDDAPVYFELMALPENTNEQDKITMPMILQRDGETAFSEGDFQKAINSWLEWKKLEPNNPRPDMMIGDVYLRMDNIPMALQFYNSSLRSDPGQVALALRMARVLDQGGKTEEARNLLNTYSLLFPGNPDVLLAQTEWLLRHQRVEQALELARRLQTLEPSNLGALTMILRLSRDPLERQANLQRVLTMGTKPEMLADLGDAIWKYDLLAIPEAAALADLVERVNQEKQPDTIRQIFKRLQPLHEVVTERFPAGDLSANWDLEGGQKIGDPGRLTITSDRTRSEVTLRLLGSERLLDCFVECTAQIGEGDVWIYARRSADQYIRLGVQGKEKVFLQIWRGGKPIASRISPISLSGHAAVNLRLEIRGLTVMGYVDGRPVLPASLTLPDDFNLGWSGVSAFDPTRGRAQLNLSYLAAGPLPFRWALVMNLNSPVDVEQAFMSLRSDIYALSGISPRWYQIDADGNWKSLTGLSDDLFRLFAKFHRVRMIPAVDVQGRYPSADEILLAAKRLNADGFMFLLPALPTPEWLNELNKPQIQALNLIVTVMGAGKNRAEIYPLGAANELLPVGNARFSTDVLPWVNPGSGKHDGIKVYPQDKSILFSM